MVDLIDRQAAIDAMHKYWDAQINLLPFVVDGDMEICSYMSSYQKILRYNKELSGRIRGLPSAQPDPSTCWGCNCPKMDFERTPERKKGKWIGEADGYADGELVFDMWSCGCCGKRFDEWEDKPDWSFCPNCGAEMGD